MSTQPQAPPPPPPFEKVSAVIVSWNNAAALRRALTALGRSRHRELIEIIVVDAGSRDACTRVDEEFPDVMVQRMPRNFGLARARNIGIRTATGDSILLLDPNVEVRPETVSELALRLKDDESASAVAPRIDTPAGQPIESRYAVPDAAALAAACLVNEDLPADPTGGAIRPYCLLLRKRFLSGMNYFSEKHFTQHWGELELAWQIRNAGKKMLLCEDLHVVLHAAEAGPALDAAARALLHSDRIHCGAAWLGKHAGFAVQIAFLLRAVFTALGRFDLRLLSNVVSGARVDGTQGGVLG